MKKKGFYVALIASLMLIVATGTILISVTGLKTDKTGEIYTKEIVETKRVWQNARLVLDDQISYLAFIQECPGNFIFDESVLNTNFPDSLDHINLNSEINCNAEALNVDEVNVGDIIYTVDVNLSCWEMFGKPEKPQFGTYFEKLFTTKKRVQNPNSAACVIIDEQAELQVYP